MSAANEPARWSENRQSSASFVDCRARSTTRWAWSVRWPVHSAVHEAGGLLSQGVLLRHARNILVTWTSEHHWNTAIGAMVIRI